VKFREIFRFEFVYQARRVRTWLYFAVLFAVAYLLMRTAGAGDGFVNSPYAVAQQTVLTGLLWILMAPAVAGSAAARDVQTRMHSLIYAAPISKADYLGGRFLAAFALNALILLAVPLGILAALFVPGGVGPEFLAPLRPAVYLSSYGVLALPTAFTFTAVQFSFAALKRRAILSYLGTVLFFVTVGAAGGLVLNVLQMPAVGSKSFLITIGDRTVGGLTARDQMVGPWQVPVADVAVTATSLTTGIKTGEAMAMGEKPTLALISPASSARMAVAESLMNLTAADLPDRLHQVKLSANWMSASTHPGEGAGIYEAVEALGMDLCPKLGISIPVGKDSMSMKMKWQDQQTTEPKEVTAPLSVVISAFDISAAISRRNRIAS